MDAGLSGGALLVVVGAFAFSLLVFGAIAEMTYAGVHSALSDVRSAWRRVIGLQLALLAILAGHVLVTTMWVLLLLRAGVFAGPIDAAYYVLSSYTTVGYGDVVATGRWRGIGPVIAVDGLLMFGISTALLVGALSEVHAARHRGRAG